MRTIPKHPSTRRGRYEVRQLVPDWNEEMRTDFDAELWAYEWLTIRGITVLRLYEINLEDDATSFSFQEFTGAVSVKFLPEDN